MTGMQRVDCRGSVAMKWRSFLQLAALALLASQTCASFTGLNLRRRPFDYEEEAERSALGDEIANEIDRAPLRTLSDPQQESPIASPMFTPAMSPLMTSPSLYVDDSPAIMTPSVFVYDYLGLDSVGSSPALTTSEPKKLPSSKPTDPPTPEPTSSPTLSPSVAPTTSPTLTTTEPTAQPTLGPTEQPTSTTSLNPTGMATESPTGSVQVSSELGVEFLLLRADAPTVEPSSAIESTPNPTTISQEMSEPTLQPSVTFDSAETGAPQTSMVDITLEPTLKPSDAISSAETAAPQADGGTDTAEPTLESAETGAPQASVEDTTEEPTKIPTLEPSSAVSSATTPTSQTNEPSTPFMPGQTPQPTKALSEQPVAESSYDASPTLPLSPAGYNLDSPIESPVLSPVHSQLEDVSLIGWLGRGQGAFSSTLSRDGSTVAIAYKGEHDYSDQTVCVSIYRYNPDGGTWVQIGDDIVGDLYGDEEGVGNSVALSYDGNTIAVGFFSAPCGRGIVQASCGRVSVYFYNGAGWMNRGDIFSEHPNDLSGYSLSMSDDGLRLAIGSPTNAGPGGTSSGQVRLFELDPTDDWKQLATDIEGDDSWDYFGHSVAISADGTTLACGAVEALPGEVGYVKVYRYNDTADSFDQLGTDLGKDMQDHVAFSLSLSSDGNSLAIGFTPQEGVGNISGIARVYQYENDSWGLQTPDILGGYNRKDKFGYSVSLDAKRNMLVVGAPETDTMRGSVTLYDIRKGTWSLLEKLRSSEPMSSHDYGRSVKIADSGSLFAVGSRSGAYVYAYPIADAGISPTASPISQTLEPTVLEDTAIPTNEPTAIVSYVSFFTERPTTGEEIPEPTAAPSESTTKKPTQEDNSVIDLPTDSPTEVPSESPTLSRADLPTSEPSVAPRTPVDDPTTSATAAEDSTAIPTTLPTVSPTLSPTEAASPTNSPTDLPTISPTKAITAPPSDPPSRPTDSSTTAPNTSAPTSIPTMEITLSPTRPPVVLTVSPTIDMRPSGETLMPFAGGESSSPNEAPSDGNQLPPYWGSSYVYDESRQPVARGTNGLQEPSYYLDDETSAPIQQPASDYYYASPVISPIYYAYYGEPTSGDTASPQAYGDETRTPV